MAEQTDPRLLAVLERIAGALEKLAAVDRGERPDLEPTNEWVKQQRGRHERESTGAPIGTITWMETVLL